MTECKVSWRRRQQAAYLLNRDKTGQLKLTDAERAFAGWILDIGNVGGTTTTATIQQFTRLLDRVAPRHVAHPINRTQKESINAAI
jgi:hypothetical protein